MRLICPRCGAEYEVEDRLIPASGREVQCSSCDHVWFQLGRLRMLPPVVPPPAPVVVTDEAPRMGRALPEDVMDILRDEAAHFRASHPGLDAPAAAEAPADPDAVTGADLPGVEESPAPAAEAAPLVTPEPMVVAEADRTDPPAEDKDHETIADRIAAPEPAPTAPQPQPSPTTADPVATPEPAPAAPPSEWPQPEPAKTAQRSGGFGWGFLIGLIIAAGFYALYRAAPGAGEGLWGDILRSIRAAGDALHQWVQARIAGFR